MNTRHPLKSRTIPSVLGALASMAFLISDSTTGAWATLSDTVVAWGYNGFGQTIVPVGLSNVVAVTAGGHFTVALKQDGRVVAWGANNQSQTNVPGGLSNVVGIAAGFAHTLALKGDGTVVGWGENGNGQVTPPPSLSNVVAIAARERHSVALKQDGRVVAWGYNSDGQTDVPASLSNVVAIATGYAHTVALKGEGTVMTWGLNNVGQRNVPYGLSNVVAIAAGNYHTVALKSDGTVVAWERNDIGESSVPEGLSNVVAIAAGYAHTVALKQDGTMVAWGYNFFGQSTVPTGLNDVVKIAAGFNHIVVIGRLPPSITAQPFGSAVTVGQSVNFSVAATATGTGPLSYQWRKDGTDILGATDVTFTISAVADTDTGNYSVVVTNSGGSVTSAVAVLTVLNTPVFSVEPFGQSVGVGSNVVFSATAYGAPPLVFQWYFNGSPSGSATTGTNVSLHTLTNVQTNKSGNYSVRVFNGYGSAASAGAALNVIVFPPTITIQPSSQNPLLGHGASFAVSVIGTPPFQYQWQFNGADIPGATNVTYTIPAVTASDAGNYAAMISNSAESVRSDDAALTVVIPPTLGLQTLAGYPLLSLNGMLGSNFSVQFISNWPATNWLNLRSISNLSVNPYQFLDTGGSTQPTRYYRAVMQ